MAIGVARRGSRVSGERTLRVPPSCSFPVSHSGGPHVASFVRRSSVLAWRRSCTRKSGARDPALGGRCFSFVSAAGRRRRVGEHQGATVSRGGAADHSSSPFGLRWEGPSSGHRPRAARVAAVLHPQKRPANPAPGGRCFSFVSAAVDAAGVHQGAAVGRSEAANYIRSPCGLRWEGSSSGHRSCAARVAAVLRPYMRRARPRPEGRCFSFVSAVGRRGRTSKTDRGP